jgi:hypothetical protein
MKKILFLLALMIIAGKTTAQTEQDKTEVTRAMLDYLEGFYEGDTAKLSRSVPEHSINMVTGKIPKPVNTPAKR